MKKTLYVVQCDFIKSSLIETIVFEIPADRITDADDCIETARKEYEDQNNEALQPLIERTFQTAGIEYSIPEYEEGYIGILD